LLGLGVQQVEVERLLRGDVRRAPLVERAGHLHDALAGARLLIGDVGRQRLLEGRQGKAGEAEEQHDTEEVERLGLHWSFSTSRNLRLRRRRYRKIPVQMIRLTPRIQRLMLPTSATPPLLFMVPITPESASSGP